MNDSDFELFAEFWAGAIEATGRVPTAGGIDIAFEVLAPWSIDVVRQAVIQHLRDPSVPPATTLTPNSITRRITARGLSPDELIGLARACNTPLGVLLHIHMGWELDNDVWLAKQRAHEARALIPDWEARIARQGFTTHELQVMTTHGVSPDAPFAPAMVTLDFRALPSLPASTGTTLLTDASNHQH